MPHLDSMGGMAILGTGSYGSVYRTNTPGIVLKVTHDPDEVSFVMAAMEIGTWPAGMVRYYGIYRFDLPYTEGPEASMPAYALWREEAPDPAALEQGLASGFPFEAVMDYVVLAQALRNRGRGGRAKRQEALELGGRPWPEDLAKKAKAWAFGPARKWPDFPAEERALTPDELGALWWALRARLKKLVLDPSPKESVLSAVAEALLFYMDNGILITDAHEDNFGVVDRDGEPTLAIRDPGVSMFFTTGFDDVIAPVELLVANPRRLKARLLRL